MEMCSQFSIRIRLCYILFFYSFIYFAVHTIHLFSSYVIICCACTFLPQIFIFNKISYKMRIMWIGNVPDHLIFEEFEFIVFENLILIFHFLKYHAYYQYQYTDSSSLCLYSNIWLLITNFDALANLSTV